MRVGWSSLSDGAQLALAREALIEATRGLTSQAMQLAEEIEAGTISDRGGADALRLFAGLLLAVDVVECNTSQQADSR